MQDILTPNEDSPVIVETEGDGDGARVVVGGEVHIASASAVTAHLEPVLADSPRVTVDLRPAHLPAGIEDFVPGPAATKSSDVPVVNPTRRPLGGRSWSGRHQR